MSKPAHNSTTAGQIDNMKELDKLAFKPKRLGDIIDRVQRQEAQRQFEPGIVLESGEFIGADKIPKPLPEKKKLTFEEWWKQDRRVGLG